MAHQVRATESYGAAHRLAWEYEIKLSITYSVRYYTVYTSLPLVIVSNLSTSPISVPVSEPTMLERVVPSTYANKNSPLD